MGDRENDYIIIEAKRGWVLPGEPQLRLYSERSRFINSPAKVKVIVSMSECTEEYAKKRLPVIPMITVLHLPWMVIWNNFKYILEQNNKAKLNDVPLSDSEFAKIKNDLSHASFYDAGKWMVGENGKVYVHVPRGNETLHLMVMNNEHVAGGSSVYEVINQYQAFKTEDTEGDRDRRFDVTLLINGIPFIHIELKCHRAVTPQTKRDLEKFFTNSLWYGFTGTPIFDENSYEQKGDLAQTTEQLYGECLHSYTIKEAIHDEAVLGFMVENLGAKDLSAEDTKKVYETEEHMRKVLHVILNQSYDKFGMKNGRGKTYEAILTTSSIAMAQKYYDLLKKVKEGNDELKISDDIHKALPDFPKFAITYSLSENDEASIVNQDKMKKSLIDYNDFAHLKSFSVYEPPILDEFGFSEEEYENYAAMYKNVMEELKKPEDNPDDDKEPVWDDYDLVAYSKLRIDFEYIVELLRGVVESLDQSQNDFDEVEFETRIRAIREMIAEFADDNPKLGILLTQVVDEIEKEKERFLGQDISVIINQMRYAAIDTEIRKYAEKWYLDFEEVKYEAFYFRDGELANENKLKDSADYATYKEENEDALPKFKFRKLMVDEFKTMLMPEILPLL